MDKSQLDELAVFIREHRSSESNFDKLSNKLDEAANNGSGDFSSSLSEVKEKLIPPYQKARETGGSAWPEFEKFVSEFEKTVTEAIRENGR